MRDIIIIAPFQELFLSCKEIVEKSSHKDIFVTFGDLSQGVIEAKRAVNKGAKVIISRGRTYTMIKEVVDIPVVEIKMTSFDLLRGFKDIVNYEGKIGVVGNNNIIDGSELIGELLNIDMVKIKIENQKDVEEIIRPYIKQGINLFIGDTIANSACNKLNCTYSLITSGIDSVINAMTEARSVLKLSRFERERTEQFKTIMDFVHDGIISIDENNKIILINDRAKRIFGLEKDVVGELSLNVLDNTRLHHVLKTGIPELGELQDVGPFKIATNRVPIIVDNKIKGVVATFSDITELQQLEKEVRIKLSKKGFLAKYHFRDIIYSSEIMHDSIIQAKKYSIYDSPILILGNSGVGKELFAQSIHNYSKRKSSPFVAINCAALPPNLIESELFGYVEGAFTGANKNGKPGLFELAHGGTIFLDEISELPFELQGRLLRVLQEKEVMRIGDDKVMPIDVRILTATNKNLTKLMRKGNFREDLFFRINVLSLNIPSLKERSEDIHILVEYFISKYSKKYNKTINDIDNSILEYLRKHKFKGNVRELEGIIERGIILSTGNTIKISDLNILEEDIIEDICDPHNNKLESHNFYIDEELNLDEINKKYIEHIIKIHNGSINKSSRILGISRSTIWRKLK